MRLTPLIVTLALGACAPAAPESSPLDPGKADNPVSAGECLFGETFSGALDSEDFEISGERVIDEHSSLNSVEEAQILKGLSADEFGITDAREAVRELTQDQELRQWTMVSNVTDHDPFTAYEFHAGDNPVGFAFTMDALELVMEHGDDDVWFCTVLRDDGGCGLDGVYRVVGDFPSFLEWTLEVKQGQLVDSFTDDLDSDEWNTTHHTRSGLVERVKASDYDEHRAAQETIEFLQTWVPQGASPMCGNTICQDRRFMARHMPALEAYFHYRNLDVSTLKILMQRWRPELEAGFIKTGTHLALDDIRESINEMRYYREHFLKLG